MEVLPNEVMVRILKYFTSPTDVFSIRRSCHRLRDLIDHVVRTDSLYWKTACCRDIKSSCYESIRSDPLFDQHFPDLSQLSISELELSVKNERFWRLIYIVYLRLSSLKPDAINNRKPQLVKVNLRNIGFQLVSLYNRFIAAVIESSAGSQTSILVGKLPSTPNVSERSIHLDGAAVLQSMPGRCVFISIASGFPKSRCERISGPSYEMCPMCNRNPDEVYENGVCHLSIIYVHDSRGLEITGICVGVNGQIKPLKNAPQWRQSIRQHANLNFEMTSLHRNVLKVMFRANNDNFHEIFHLRGDCSDLGNDHCKIVFPNGKPRMMTFNDCASVTIFRRNDEHPTDFMQASIDWGGRMGSGGIVDDLRKIPNSIAITKALHLSGQTLLLSITRSETDTNSSSFPSNEHVLVERNLRVLNISTVGSVSLSRLCSRSVTCMDSLGSTTVLGTDSGKVILLNYGPQRLATVIQKFNVELDSLSEDQDISAYERKMKSILDKYILFSCSTDGRSVTDVRLSLYPPYLRICVCTGGENLSLFHL